MEHNQGLYPRRGPPFRDPFNPRDGYPRPGTGNAPLADREVSVPYNQQPDHRLPPPNTFPHTPHFLETDGFQTHSLILLPPNSPLLTDLLGLAKRARAASIETPPEDLVERALDRKTLTHISDGPTGGIWLVDAGREELISCLVLEFKSGWEVLGIGAGLFEGATFLRHPCGFGPEPDEYGSEEDEEEEETTARRGFFGKRDKKGKSKGDMKNVVNSKAWLKARDKEAKSKKKADEKALLKERGINDPISKVLHKGMKLLGLGDRGEGPAPKDAGP